MVDQVQHRQLCPLKIVDHHDQCIVRGDRLQETPCRPGGLLGGGAGLHQSDGSRQTLCDHLGVGLTLQKRLDPGSRGRGVVFVRDSRQRTDNLPEWPVRDALTVGQASAIHRARLRCVALDEVADDPGLAHPGRAQDGEEVTDALGDDLLPCFVE